MDRFDKFNEIVRQTEERKSSPNIDEYIDAVIKASFLPPPRPTLMQRIKAAIQILRYS